MTILALLGVAIPTVVIVRSDDGPAPIVSATFHSPSPSPSMPFPTDSLDPDEVFLPWGPSQGDVDRALEDVRAMPLEEVAGLVIVARFKGTSAADLTALIETYHVGGVSLPPSSTLSTSQVESLIAAAQAAQDAEGRDWPFIVAADQEGGTVAHLGDLLPDMPSFMAAGAAKDKSAVEYAFAGVGRDMAALGFTWNFAPVADMTIGLADPVIRTRSPGSDPQEAGEAAIAAADGLLDAGIIPAVKHFPGHGGVTVDSHKGTPLTNESIASLERTDLVPFQMAIDAGAPVIMMAHVVVSDWGDLPATINPEAYAYLRDEMGFTGIAITDSMGMGALNSYGWSGTLVAKAVAAGADLVLMPVSNSDAHYSIVHAVEAGWLPRERLDEAASRVVALMRYQAGLDPAVEVEGDYVRVMSRASATVVTPLCGTRLVGSEVTISGGWAYQRTALAAALQAHGVRVGTGGQSILLLTGDDSAGTADIVVSLGGPWGLSRSHASTYIAMYGGGSSTLAALADILVNSVDANAQWPVPVPGLPYGPCPSPR